MAVSCRALGVSQAWFFKWRTRDRSPRRKRRAALAPTIAYLSANHSGTYGSPRIAADLRAMNWRVSKSTVTTLMAEAGVLARRKRRRPGTATPDKSARKAPDGLRRDFTPDAAAGRALVPGSHRNPHRRRQTPPRDGAGSVFAALRPIPDTGWCTVSSPRSASNPSAGHPPSVSESSGLTTPCRSTWLAHTNVFVPQSLSFDKRSGGQRGGVDRRRCPVWRPLRFWPMGARRVGVSVSRGVLRNTRRNLPI